jgi:hypothetical protein
MTEAGRPRVTERAIAFPAPDGTSLEARLRLLEDHEAIRQLKAFYARCADSKYTADHRRKPQAEIDAITRRQVDTVFTEDGIWDGGKQFGTLHGREAIYNHLRGGRWNFAMHYFVNPVIAVNGDAAHATWMLWQPATFEQKDQAVWMSAITEDDYVRTAQGWQLQHYTVVMQFITRFDQPWSIDRNAPIRL